jgi:hypothetical protein
MLHYLVFAGENYYPGGGWLDFIGRYRTYEEALLVATEKGTPHYAWAHIVHEDKIVLCIDAGRESTPGDW